MTETPILEDELLFEKKCLKVGLLMSSKISTIILSKLHVNYSKNLYNNIINNPPNPYPSSTRITELNSQKHALYGQWFETSMLCYDVSNCNYCWHIFINHDDNLLIKEKCILLNDLI